MRSKLFYLLTMVFLAVSACKKDEDQPPSNTNNGGGGNTHPGSVYVCGTVSTGGFGNVYPRYWKDGTEHIVGDGSRGTANDIHVNDQQIIIVGGIYNNSAMTPCYWIDNQPVELLSYACGGCLAHSVYVVGENDVHIAGYAMDDGVFNSNYKAMYWHNGVGTELTDGLHDARAKGVFVYNGDVYVCGYEEDGSGGRNLAKYWLNGEPVILGDDIENSYAMDIWVDQGIVYVVGSEDIEDLFGNNIQTPVLWVNGVRQALPGGVADGEANRVFMENGNVYIVGYIEPFAGNSNTQGVYWVNGTVNGIYSAQGAPNGTSGSDIAVHNGVVHTVQAWGGVTGLSGHYANNAAQTEAFLGNITNGVFVH
jgi:hypothetical protein